MAHSTFCLGVLILSALPHVAVPAHPVTLQVRESDGAPAAGATLSSLWLARGPGAKPIPHDDPALSVLTVQADAEGRAILPSDAVPKSLMAMNRDRTSAAVYTRPVGGDPPTIELVLRPMISVSGTITCQQLDYPLKGIAGGITMPKAGQIINWRGDDKTGRFVFSLLPGRYAFRASSDETRMHLADIDVPAGQSAVDLGIISVEPAPITAFYGKAPPPITVTAARGLPQTFQLADLRGKWVLMEFWTFYCIGCVSRSLPELMDVYDKLADQRERFEIVAFHVADVPTIAELDARLAEVRAKLWNDRQLPFPVLLDHTGDTIAKWGVAAYPTHVLLDPQGNVVRGGSIELLEATLSTNGK